MPLGCVISIRPIRLAVLLLLTVAFVAIAAQAKVGAAPSPYRVTVFRDQESDPLAVFRTARCTKRQGSFKALARSTDNKYSLFVSIENFTGFHRYDLDLDKNADPFFSLTSVFDEDAPHYTNLNKPHFKVAAFGGIAFRNKGGLMGIGSDPAFDGTFKHKVALAGVVRCRYGKR